MHSDPDYKRAREWLKDHYDQLGKYTVHPAAQLEDLDARQKRAIHFLVVSDSSELHPRGLTNS